MIRERSPIVIFKKRLSWLLSLACNVLLLLSDRVSDGARGRRLVLQLLPSMIWQSTLLPTRIRMRELWWPALGSWWTSTFILACWGRIAEVEPGWTIKRHCRKNEDPAAIIIYVVTLQLLKMEEWPKLRRNEDTAAAISGIVDHQLLKLEKTTRKPQSLLRKSIYNVIVWVAFCGEELE
jgi:hypothetical protein